MKYGHTPLKDGGIFGSLEDLPEQPTSYDDAILTKVLMRHEGNIVNVAHTTFPPLKGRELHANADVDKLLLVTSGELQVTVGTDIRTLIADAGNYAYIPHGVEQAVYNTSDQSADLLCIAIRNENFVHLNQTLSG